MGVQIRRQGGALSVQCGPPAVHEPGHARGPARSGGQCGERWSVSGT